MQLLATLRTINHMSMRLPPWLSELLEFAELLLTLMEHEETRRILQQVDDGAIDMTQAIEQLRQVNRARC